MATKAKPRKKAPDILDQQHTSKSDWAKFVEQVHENPVLYGAIALFLVLCVVAGIVYRTASGSSLRSLTTQFAQAAQNEDPALRAAELRLVWLRVLILRSTGSP